MKLRDYLDREKIRPSAFAEQLAVPPSTVIRWINGERSPRAPFIVAIEQITKGEVTASDFLAPPSTKGPEAA